MAKFLHAADLHLGQGGGDALSCEAAEIREREIRESLVRIVDLALEKKVDLLLVAGDLFTDSFASPALLRFVNYQFARLKGKEVLLCAGNHDPLFAGSPADIFPWQEHVFFFPADSWQRREFADLNLAVTGLSWGRERPEEEFLAQMPPPVPGLFNLALLHGSAGEAASLSADYFPLPTEKLAGLGYQYYALGHYHKPSSWQRGNTTFAYSGSPEALGFDEAGVHGVWLGDTASGELALEFIPLGRREYFTIKWDVTGITSEGELVEKLTEALAGKKQDLVRLILVGTLPSGFGLDLRSLAESLKELVFSLSLTDETEEEIPFSDFPPGSIRQLFSQAILWELEKTQESSQRRLLELALCYGLAALTSGKVEVERGTDFDY